MAGYLLDDAPPPSPAVHRPGLDPKLARICAKAIRKPAAERYASMNEFAAALEGYLREAERKPVVQPLKQKRKPWALKIAAAIAAFALVAAAIYIATDRGTIVVHAHDQHVRIDVLQGGEVVRFIDTETNSQVTLRSGTYDVALQGKSNGLRLIPNRIVLTRGEKTIVEVEQVANQAETTAGAQPQDRAADQPATNIPEAPRLPDNASPEAFAAMKMLQGRRLPEDVRAAMEVYVMQNPMQTRWSNQTDKVLFAIAARKLPGGEAKAKSQSLMASAAHKTAIGEILLLKAALDTFADQGLTDSDALQSSLKKASGSLEIVGEAKGASHEAGIIGDYAVAYVMAPRDGLTAALRTPTAAATVKAAYREAVREKIQIDVKQGRTAEALQRWRHLLELKLDSPELYLDIAAIHRTVGQLDESLHDLQVAFDTFADSANDEYLSRLGEAALDLNDDAANDLAARAYEAASKKLESTQSP